jgi:tetratricopeptide (TPR) repeat protein
MTRVRRLAVVSAVLGAVSAFSWSNVWATLETQSSQPAVSGSKTLAPASDKSLGDDLASSKFATRKVVSYRTRAGDLFAAVQLKPSLETTPARPRDILFLVDTSASQVGGPLANSCILIEEMFKDARPGDRVSLWTANIPDATKDLTRGFHDAKSDRVKDAFKELKNEVPLGNTDLANAVEKASASFDVDTAARQRVLVFLGDGMSVYNPLSAGERAKLSADLVQRQIAFFSVPLGAQFDSRNLHGLATGTGGLVVRILPTDKPADTGKRLVSAIAAPVLYPTQYQVTGVPVNDCFPTKLPPLRNDVPTLVIARLKDAKDITFQIDGKIGGKETRLQVTEPVAAAELDNFFLVGMFEQWKNAKDQPALTQADRALAYAEAANNLARTEFLAQAHEALVHKKFDAAAKLFKQAKDLDPNDVEADAGLKAVQKLKEGRLTLEQLRRQPDRKEESGQDEKNKNGKLVSRREQPEQQAQEPTPPPAPAEDFDVDPKELLRRQQMAQQVEDQRVIQQTNDAVNEARRALRTDPEGARERLKYILSGVRENFDISDEVRRRLVSQLESTLRYVEVEGARIQRDQAERLAVLARAEGIQARLNRRFAVEEQTQQRMLRFAELMRTGRYEDGFRMAVEVRQDLIDQGFSLNMPPAVTAAGFWSLAAHHVREAERLRFLKEERYLATMLEVEKAAVPFPDEPPMVYPPTAQWRAMTAYRKEKYESTGIADEDPNVIRRIREIRNRLSTPITIDRIDQTLGDALLYLQEKYGIPIIIDEVAFDADLGEKDIRSRNVKLDKLSGVSLGTVLRLLLAQVQGTYIIRREFLEVTTGQAQLREKTIRVYDVADLVIPIPNAINQAGVNQTLQNSILGGGVSPFGGTFNFAGGGLGFNLGIGGALGFAGNLGAFGFGGFGVQPFAGVAGAAGPGGAGGLLGGQGGPVNLGVQGGGFVGFAGFGGQLGQLGNLGGQFGLQGGDQSQILITLITQVVGTAADWSPLGAFQRPAVGIQGQVGNPLDDPNTAGDPNIAGALGYYPPARALVVKGTSRVHTRLGGGLTGPRGGPPPIGALDRKRDDRFGQGKDPDKNPIDPKARAAKDKPAGKPAGAAVTDLDAKKIWQDALARGVNDPGLIIACADYLGEHGKFDHAAEFLKANLRQAIVARPWVYEALALALKECKGSVTDIERAQLSTIDLQPQDSASLLKAAEDMREAGRYDRAVVMCRQASVVQPDSPGPYLEAARAAEQGNDTEAMAWATANLLSRDWPVDDKDIHRQAAERMKNLTTSLKAQNRVDDADRITAQFERQRQRDLIIELIWSGDADLDLEIKEPIGTSCSFANRQTPGGGILVGDHLLERSRETYKAAEAFPGEYQITVRRIWGQPLGNKATLRIIQNQGTSRENLRQETIIIDPSHTLTVSVLDGRRNALAQVPPTSSRPQTRIAQTPRGGDTMTRLRGLADPTVEVNTGLRGGIASSGTPVERARPPLAPPNPKAQVAYQTRVATVPNSMDVIAKMTVLPDGRRGWSVSPVFETAGRVQATAVVNLPLIPGGKDDGG